MTHPKLLRTLVLSCMALGGCGYTPQQLGITGPGTSQTTVISHASEADQDALLPMPGLHTGTSDDPEAAVPPNFGAPSTLPSFGNNGRFYGYN